MKKRFDYWLHFAVALVIMVSAVILLGIAGDIDYCDQIILMMSQEEYDAVKAELTIQNGHSPSDRQIAHYWADSKK